jgi:WS/DGAT/MGAT family acyltransferase
VHKLSPLDAAFLSAEKPGMYLHIGGLMLFKGRPDLPHRAGAQGLFDVVRARLPLLPRCRQRIVSVPLGLGHPVWADDPDFDLRRHLRRITLRPPGGWRELHGLVARLHALPLDRSHPLWEIYLIDGLDDGRVAVYLKLHHAMADGISAVELGLALFDLDAAGEIAPAVPSPPEPQPAPDAMQLLRNSARGAAQQVMRRAGDWAPLNPADFGRRLGDTISSAASMRDLVPLLRPVPSGPLNQPLGPRRRLEMVSLPLSDAKAIKNRDGYSINDVVLATVGEAVSIFLEHRGQSRSGLRYRTLVPVSVRDDADKASLGNRLTGMFLDLPVGPMAPGRRLWAVAQAMSQLKNKSQGAAAEQFVELTALSPPPLHAAIARFGVGGQRLVNLIVSNVPGVQMPVYCAGSQLLESYPLLPLGPNMSVVICVLSYNNALHFGLVGDADAVPDLDVLARARRPSAFPRLQHPARPRPQPKREMVRA